MTSKLKNIKSGFLLICLFTFLLGCDFIITKEKPLIGDISLINPQTQSDNGYSLVFIDGSGVNDNLLKDYVKNIRGNDSILIAKCVNENGDFTFYKIDHNKGQKPIKTTNITLIEFNKIKANLKVEYTFSDE